MLNIAKFNIVRILISIATMGFLDYYSKTVPTEVEEFDFAILHIVYAS